MKKELQDRLFADFPHLYGDHNKPMTESCMCWGIDCDDGWYKIIRELSEKLEALIVQYRKNNPNTSCYICACPKDSHYASRGYNTGKCLAIHKRANKHLYSIWRGRKKFYQRWFFKAKWVIYSVINWFYDNFNYTLLACHCEKYEPCAPRASQVKEKYGTLSFYMTTGTDEIFNAIYDTEAKSATVCELCGAVGEVRNDGWIITRCDACYVK